MDPDFDLQGYIMHHVLNGTQWNVLPPLPPIHLPAWLTLHGLMLIFAAAGLLILFGVIYNKKSRVPSGLTNMLEAFVVYIRDEIAIANMGEEDGRKFTPLLCTYFFFILTLNLMGLVPLFSTATANINVTFSLAFITLFVMIFGAIYKNGFSGFLKVIIPHGVPIPVLIILVPIEFVGLFIKGFALMIRLFANMLAGHIVIFSLLGLIVLMGFAALPAIALALFIYILEVFVAFLQAYVFTLLSAMFIGQTFHPEH